MAENNCIPSALIGAKHIASHQFFSRYSVRKHSSYAHYRDKGSELQKIALHAQSHIVSE